MLKTRCIALIAAFLPVCAYCQTLDQVQGFAARYFDAYTKGNIDDLLLILYPPFLERIKKTQDVRKYLTDSEQRWKEEGLLPTRYDIDRIDWFRGENGKKIFLLQWTVYVNDAPDNRLEVIIPDNGPGFSILSLGCISTKWIDSIAPGFSKTALSDQLIKDRMLLSE